MNFKAGTLPWLLRYEIWLWWREFRGKWFVITLSILLGLLMIVPLILWLSLFSV